MPKEKVDPIGRYLAEYMSGYRCLTCDGLRHRGRCDHERAEDFDTRKFEIEQFIRSTGQPDPADRRSNLLYGAASSALKRASLQAGNRDTCHGDVMADHRGRQTGKAIEWRPHQRPSGDELPL